MFDPTIKMAEAYWNAYRDGYYVSGGRLDYPLWAGSRDPVRNETARCMAFAAQVLKDELLAAFYRGDDLPTILSDWAPPAVDRRAKPIEASATLAAVHDAHKVSLAE